MRATAELAGLSESYLSRIERGQRPVERRSTLEALANALRVVPNELTGQPLRSEGRTMAAAHGTIPALRLALLETELGETADLPPRPRDELERAVTELTDLHRACRYDEIGAELPGLLRALHTAVADPGGERRRAAELLFAVSHIASSMARNLGYPDLAHIAAERTRRAAETADDPGRIAAAARTGAYALMSASAHDRALVVASRAADVASRLDGKVGTAPVAAVHGALLLASSFAAAVTCHAEEAEDRLSEAERIAERVGKQGMDAFGFGPTNVAQHRLSAAVESGDVGRALALASRIDTRAIDSRERQACYWTDYGRALAAGRDTREQAVVAFRRGEDLAPLRVRSNVFVRETVTDLLRRSRRDAGGRELRGMAYRMGVAG